MRFIIPISIFVVAIVFLIVDILKSKNKLTSEQIQKNIMANKIINRGK
jgi:hypothetical protein